VVWLVSAALAEVRRDEREDSTEAADDATAEVFAAMSEVADPKAELTGASVLSSRSP